MEDGGRGHHRRGLDPEDALAEPDRAAAEGTELGGLALAPAALGADQDRPGRAGSPIVGSEGSVAARSRFAWISLATVLLRGR